MKYHYPAGKPDYRIKKGDRFETLTDNTYYHPDKPKCRQVFPVGSKATFLGWRLWERVKEEPLWKWPKFQFDNDNHKERVLQFDQLKKYEQRIHKGTKKIGQKIQS